MLADYDEMAPPHLAIDVESGTSKCSILQLEAYT